MRAFRPALLGLLSLMVAGCGPYSNVEPDNPTTVADGLVLTSADGSSYEIKDAEAGCLTSDASGTEYVYLSVEAGPGPDPRPTFVLEVASGVTGTRQLPLRDRRLLTPDKTGMGPVDLLVLAKDPRSGARLGAFERRARGTVTVTEADCHPDPRLTFRIDATLPGPAGRQVHVRGGLATVS